MLFCAGLLLLLLLIGWLISAAAIAAQRVARLPIIWLGSVNKTEPKKTYAPRGNPSPKSPLLFRSATSPTALLYNHKQSNTSTKSKAEHNTTKPNGNLRFFYQNRDNVEREHQTFQHRGSYSSSSSSWSCCQELLFFVLGHTLSSSSTDTLNATPELQNRITSVDRTVRTANKCPPQLITYTENGRSIADKTTILKTRTFLTDDNTSLSSSMARKKQSYSNARRTKI